SPVDVEPSLTWTFGVQLVQPLSALAALTKTCRWVGSVVLALSAQTTKRFRALSSERTVKSVSGDPVRPSAMWTSLTLSPHGLAVVGKSRNVGGRDAPGVPLLGGRLQV